MRTADFGSRPQDGAAAFARWDCALGARRRKFIRNNTTLERRGKSIAVQLWATDVLTFLPSGAFVVTTGGYCSVTTTRTRVIGEFLPGSWRFRTADGAEFLGNREREWKRNGRGFRVSAAGKVSMLRKSPK